MSYNFVLSETVDVAGKSVTKQNTFSGAQHKGVDALSVADESTDQLIDGIAVDQSDIQALIIVATQDMTLETNDGTTPDDTITLLADEPLIWHTGSPYTCPITADVTAFYVTNASGAAGTITIDIVTN